MPPKIIRPSGSAPAAPQPSAPAAPHVDRTARQRAEQLLNSPAFNPKNREPVHRVGNGPDTMQKGAMFGVRQAVAEAVPERAEECQTMTGVVAKKEKTKGGLGRWVVAASLVVVALPLGHFARTWDIETTATQLQILQQNLGLSSTPLEIQALMASPESETLEVASQTAADDLQALTNAAVAQAIAMEDTALQEGILAAIESVDAEHSEEHSGSANAFVSPVSVSDSPHAPETVPFRPQVRIAPL